MFNLNPFLYQHTCHPSLAFLRFAFCIATMFIPSIFPLLERLSYSCHYLIGIETIETMTILTLEETLPLICVRADVSMGEHELCRGRLGQCFSHRKETFISLVGW